ncbi:MAG: substrate-binding domain-containing protein [Chloroflexota bacterium]
MKRVYPLIITLLAFTTLACSLFSFGSSGPGFNAVEISVVTNSSLTNWMQRSANEFNAEGFQTENGRNIFITVSELDAGTAITELTTGTNPDLWIPDEQVWVNLLADQGNNSFQANCQSVAESPLVIGMYREVAESLGWPGLPLGWLDIGSLATDSNAWRYYSGGEFGSTLRMGHTHPGLSGTGASTLLSVVQAAQSKTDAVTLTDIQQPIVQASVGAFESGVAIFSTDSASLGNQMADRGVNYLGAGIMHETTVLQSGGTNMCQFIRLKAPLWQISRPVSIKAAIA